MNMQETMKTAVRMVSMAWAGLLLASLPVMAAVPADEAAVADPEIHGWGVLLVAVLLLFGELLRRRAPGQGHVEERSAGIVTKVPEFERKQRHPWRVATLAVLAVGMLLGSVVVMAETLNVNNTADTGPGSLRAAITAANASSSDSTIVFDAATDGTPIVLASALPDLLASGGSLAIQGNGAAATIIDGNHQVRILRASYQDNFTLGVRDLTLRNGHADQDQGGAIRFNGINSVLDVSAVAFVGNDATYAGGAVYSAVSTYIDHSTFRGNSSGTFGAAMKLNGGFLEMANSSFANNGAGIATNIIQISYTSAASRLVNVTVQARSTNTAIAMEGNAVASLGNCLIVRAPHHAGTNLLYTDQGGSFDVANSWNNVIGQAGNSGFTDGANGNQVGNAPGLVGPVGDYGGPTWTLPLLPGSLAIDAGTAANNQNPDVPPLDQRGVARVGNVDVGAFESGGFQISKISGDNQSAVVGATFAQPLVVSVTANVTGEPVAGGHVSFTAPTTGPSANVPPAFGDVDSSGMAAALAVANGVAGGPYPVTASLPTVGSVSFSLTNLPDPCAGMTFPYTLAGSDNATRVANLRHAIECANAHAGLDSIDLDGQTLTLTDGPYAADGHGPTALPVITDALELAHGTLERDNTAPAFRLLQVAPIPPANGQPKVSLTDLALRNGSASDLGGAVLAVGAVRITGSRLENNHAAVAGGAVAFMATNTMNLIHASRLSGNTAPDGAAASGGAFIVASSHILANGGAASTSILDATNGLLIVSSVVAYNYAGAGALMRMAPGAALVGITGMTASGNSMADKLFDLPAGSSPVPVLNSIVWDNQFTGPGTVAFEYSLTQTPQPGPGNISQPPGFVDPANGDFSLASGSPAIDAGSNALVLSDTIDLDHDGDTTEFIPDADGAARLVDDIAVADTGIGSPGVVDMGALERQHASGAASISYSPDGAPVTTEDGGTFTFELRLERYPQADVVIPVTSSNPGEGTVSLASVTITQADWQQPHSVTVTGMDDALVDGDVPYFITVGPAASVDPAYGGRGHPGIPVVNKDNDQPVWAIGGTVTGLLGSGLQLSLNGGAQTLAVSADGNFAFPTGLPAGSAYSVTVASQPQAPVQVCSIINGNGTVGSNDISDVVVNCGSATTYAIGGTASGLTSSQSVTLQLNGGGDLTLSGNGPFQFASRLVDGASYVITIKAQPMSQLCTLTNATGQVAGSDIGNVAVNCANREALWSLSVDDGSDFARYGQVRDYLVTLSNGGNIPGTISIQALFSTAFDVPNVQWQCLALGGGTNCTPAGQGGFADVATVPPNGSITWIVSVPVFGTSQEPDATITVQSAAITRPANVQAWPAPAADTDTLVIFRDGVDVPYADGTFRILPDDSVHAAMTAGTFAWRVPLHSASGVHTSGRVPFAQATLELQHLRLGADNWVRLQVTPEAGSAYTSRWVLAAPGSLLVGGSVKGPAGPVWLLEGASESIQLRLQRVDEATTTREAH